MERAKERATEDQVHQETLEAVIGTNHQEVEVDLERGVGLQLGIMMDQGKYFEILDLNLVTKILIYLL